MTAQTPTSPRLRWRRLCAADLDTFHRLALDPHIRRYLLDGEVVDRDWCAATLAASDALFDRLGLGLWLLSHRDGTDGTSDGISNAINGIDGTLGFAGYHIFDGMGDNAQGSEAHDSDKRGREVDLQSPAPPQHVTQSHPRCGEGQARRKAANAGRDRGRSPSHLPTSPQLLYALIEPATGRGLATEAARALVTAGHAAGLGPIHSAVDGPNAASLRMLAKAGFTIDRTTPTGHFGETVWLSARSESDQPCQRPNSDSSSPSIQSRSILQKSI